MSGFVSTGRGSAPSIVPAPAPPADAPVIADGWWPSIDPAQVRDAHRLRDTVTPARLRAAIVAAMLWVGDQLAGWRAEQAAPSLADVPATTIDGQSRLVLLYRQAVAAWAHAELVERYRDMDITGAGDRKVSHLDPSIGELRRDAIHAVRQFLGRTRTRVELL